MTTTCNCACHLTDADKAGHRCQDVPDFATIAERIGSPLEPWQVRICDLYWHAAAGGPGIAVLRARRNGMTMIRQVLRAAAEQIEVDEAAKRLGLVDDEPASDRAYSLDERPWGDL